MLFDAQEISVTNEPSFTYLFIYFQEKEVPGEPLTPQDFENAKKLGM